MKTKKKHFSNPKKLNILEIGCIAKSYISLYFNSLAKCIDFTCYTRANISHSTLNTDDILKPYNLSKNYNINEQDIFNFNKKYGLTLIISVLGGICRSIGLFKTKELVCSVCRNNLSDNDNLITIDNAMPYYNLLLKKVWIV